MRRPSKPAGPAPDHAQLHEAAVQHLARFATTEAGLVRVLDRRVLRWARQAAVEGEDVEAAIVRARKDARAVAEALVRTGVIDDAAFAVSRAARLVRTGRSHRAVAAHLTAKGIGSDVTAAALAEFGDELGAAVAYTRRRRLGPFRADEADSQRDRELAAMARAGFGRDIAERALGLSLDQAEALVATLRRG